MLFTLWSTVFNGGLGWLILPIKAASRIVWLLPLQFTCFSGAHACANSQLEKEPPPKSRLKDIQLGPFCFDLRAILRLRHAYQAGFDVRTYAPGTQDQFLLTRVMVDFNLRFDSDRRLFIQFRDAAQV